MTKEEAISEKWFYTYVTDNGKQIGSGTILLKKPVCINTLLTDVSEAVTEEYAVGGLTITALNKLGDV